MHKIQRLYRIIVFLLLYVTLNHHALLNDKYCSQDKHHLCRDPLMIFGIYWLIIDIHIINLRLRQMQRIDNNSYDPSDQGR